MDDSNNIVTFGPSVSVEETQDTTRSTEESLDIDDHRGRENVRNTDIDQIQDTIHMFRGEMKDFNRAIMSGFSEMTNQMHNLIKVISEKNIDARAEIRNERSYADHRSPRERDDIIHSTPDRDVNSNHWRENANEKSRMKPQNYDGREDLDEYLTQFELVSELNNWSYRTKSLYMASSLTGDARGLLNELDPEERRDFDQIVSALKNRFGSVNKAEVFRSELQTRVKGKNETIPELAQSIKKLTRKAYPSAKADVIEILALDYFIDAIPYKDIRIRLREVCPKTVSEAEKIAVRLDAVHVADKSRNCNVKAVGASTDVENCFSKIETIMKKLDGVTEEIKEKKREKHQDRAINRQYGNNKFRNENNNWRNRPQYNQYHNTNKEKNRNFADRSQVQREERFTERQGNYHQSNLRDKARQDRLSQQHI